MGWYVLQLRTESCEEHAQYIEWNNAEDQVRFIERFEELNLIPQIASNDPRASTSAEQKSVVREYRYTAYEQPPAAEEKAADEDGLCEDISSLGKHVPGHYGARAQHATKASLSPLTRTEPWIFRQPNIFPQRTRILRTLRPIPYENPCPAPIKGQGRQAQLHFAQPGRGRLPARHRQRHLERAPCLNEYFEGEYAQRDGYSELRVAAPDFETREALPKEFVNIKIKPQPHRNSRLMYAHPPRHVVRHYTPIRLCSRRLKVDLDVGFNASFGAVVAHLERVPSHKEPLFTGTSGPTGAEVDQSVVGVRVSKYIVEQPPCVVGRHGQGLNGVTVGDKVVLSPPH
ncbi:hypothetical protein H1R20_g13822, partial [Candolleomyces eurysporus]